MSYKILETNNYGKFELLEFNRDVKKTKYLEASMRLYGFIPAHAIHVIRKGNGKFYIKEGHHRFHVARSLGLPIFYIERHDQMTIHEAEQSRVNWSIKDFVDSFARTGKAEYLAIKEYCERTGIGISNAISMLAGDSAGSGNWNAKVKDGAFRLGDPVHSLAVGDIVIHAAQCGFPWARNHLFVIALSKLCWVEEFKLPIMKAKISTYAEHLAKQPSAIGYLEMLEDIYNRGSHKRIPLSFLAEEAARKRNVAKK